MDKEFESIEIKGELGENNDIIHFDKIITIITLRLFKYYLLFHKNLNPQLKLAFLDTNKGIRKIIPFYPQFFNFKIIDIILCFNDKLCILYIYEHIAKTYILILNINNHYYGDLTNNKLIEEKIFSYFSIFPYSLNDAKMEIKKNTLIILSNNNLYFLDFIPGEKKFQFSYSFTLSNPKKIKNDNSYEEEDKEEEEENQEEESEKDDDKKKEPEKIKDFLIFKKNTILVFTDKYFFIMDIKSSKKKRYIFYDNVENGKIDEYEYKVCLTNDKNYLSVSLEDTLLIYNTKNFKKEKIEKYINEDSLRNDLDEYDKGLLNSRTVLKILPYKKFFLILFSGYHYWPYTGDIEDHKNLRTFKKFGDEWRYTKDCIYPHPFSTFNFWVIDEIIYYYDLW